jgi:hypothetical protein
MGSPRVDVALDPVREFGGDARGEAEEADRFAVPLVIDLRPFVEVTIRPLSMQSFTGSSPGSIARSSRNTFSWEEASSRTASLLS